MNPLEQGIAATPPPHQAAPTRKVPATTVASWPVGTFVENIVAYPDGGLVVAIHSKCELELIQSAKERRNFAQLPGPPTGLSLLGDDLFVSMGEPGKNGWSIRWVKPNGSSEKLLDIPEALFLNGSTPFRSSSILVVDSILGQAIEIDTRTGQRKVWLDHDLLRKITANPMMPGVNGVKAFRGHVYFSNTERAKILRAPVKPDGAAGTPEVLAERFVGDDFALDMQGNLYVTTHVHNQLQRLSPTGERTVLAGVEEAMHGSTACAFGCGPNDRNCLYVTTTGGIIAPLDGRVREAKLMRLEIGVQGAEVAGITEQCIAAQA